MAFGMKKHGPLNPDARPVGKEPPTRHEVMDAVKGIRSEARTNGVASVEIRPGVRITLNDTDMINEVVDQVMKDLKNYRG